MIKEMVTQVATPSSKQMPFITYGGEEFVSMLRRAKNSLETFGQKIEDGAYAVQGKLSTGRLSLKQHLAIDLSAGGLVGSVVTGLKSITPHFSPQWLTQKSYETLCSTCTTPTVHYYMVQTPLYPDPVSLAVQGVIVFVVTTGGMLVATVGADRLAGTF